MFPPAANIDLASKITSFSVYLLHFLALLMTNSSSSEFYKDVKKQNYCCKLLLAHLVFLGLDMHVKLKRIYPQILQTYLKSWTSFWLCTAHDKISFFKIVPAQDWQATL